MNDRLIIRLFIGVWTLVNLLQGMFTELADDEAYYWTWSQHLDWGFMEHPPMVAIFIALGSKLFGGEIGVRIMTILASSGVLWLVYEKLVRRDALLYAALVASVFLAHVGGFLTAPDSPLFLFVGLYFVFLKPYLETDSWKSSIVLMLIITGMMYSKYHGAIVLLCAIVAYPKILTRRTFWVIAISATVLYLPHIYWVLTQGGQGVGYALADRFQHPFSIEVIGNYIIGQLGVLGPLVALPLIWFAMRNKTRSTHDRVLKFTVVGMFLFFLLWSFRGRIEANWTASLVLPMIILCHQFLQGNGHARKIMISLAIPSLLLIGVVRLELSSNILPEGPWSERVAEFHGNVDRAADINSFSQGRTTYWNSYQKASKAWFYTGLKALPLNINSRPNQFLAWEHYEEECAKPAVIFYEYLQQGMTERFGSDSLLYAEANSFIPLSTWRINVSSEISVLASDTVEIYYDTYNVNRDFSCLPHNAQVSLHLYQDKAMGYQLYNYKPQHVDLDAMVKGLGAYAFVANAPAGEYMAVLIYLTPGVLTWRESNEFRIRIE